MKLLLTVNPNLCRPDYTNICPENGEPFLNLDRVVEDGEAEDILVLDALEYVPAPQLDPTVSNWIKKLAHGASILVECTDLRKVARDYTDMVISLDDVNRLLYGDQTTPHNAKKVAVSMNDLIGVFVAAGLEITKKRLVDYKFIVEAKRP